MTKALDEHFRLVRDVRAEDRLHEVLELIRSANLEPVVEGGWAVSGYGSPIESIDVDIVIHSTQYTQLHEEMLKQGLQLDAHATSEALGIDIRYGDELNSLFGKPGTGFVPDDLLEERVQKVRVHTHHGALEFSVPEPGVLLSVGTLMRERLDEPIFGLIVTPATSRVNSGGTR